MILRLRPLSTLTVLSGPMLMLKLLLSSSLGALLRLSLSRSLRRSTTWLLLRSGWMTSHVEPPPSCSCSMSWSWGPAPRSSPRRISRSRSPLRTSISLEPRAGFAGLGGGGGGNSEWNLAVLMGSDVSDGGKGSDSISVSFSSGIVVNSEAGRSAGEQATMMWRRCVLSAKKDRFSVQRLVC